MAFAAARMIKDKKDQQAKRSQDGLHGTHSQRKKPEHRRSSRSPSVSSRGSAISKTSSEVKAGQRANLRGGAKGPPGRTAVKCVKKIKGKKGRPDRYELLVTIDLELWKLNDEQVAEYKEVFMLFDKDEDGVLSFSELNIVMKSLGQRPSEKRLLSMVRAVSEDHLYDTIEFNEFLQMMSKQQKEDVSIDCLLDAFRIFDKDEDGFITVEELTRIMTSLGEKMAQKELNEMIKEADSDGDGLINYQEFCGVLCIDNSKTKTNGNTKTEKQKRKSITKHDRINEENKENDNSISENNNNNNNNETLKTG